MTAVQPTDPGDKLPEGEQPEEQTQREAEDRALIADLADYASAQGLTLADEALRLIWASLSARRS
ncbi:hypothetical protein [Roseomonas chloroacetimidivorans]|jgi:hypothetical protein|uniref:hypothetical protein n=1 Tax=Roseomonas chloroacetimidivorans TaxID=1766656 RepID=UPI003C788969